ncbi:Hypothetical protein H16_B1376 [Cupriavidus necator H16]|uniref:Uncharacterized protein n=1 Tax=Cupriavidus necator (strain ATCC 17699 / DSM 428 / KCTC 22496 / NCIMB 10442 / H16 / Stanier 337) TaxID=381666 RepID=Q0K1F9_CUPNH|nr:Hypothetical protein H16_B1376 [Cupriavidus necator H16]
MPASAISECTVHRRPMAVRVRWTPALPNQKPVASTRASADFSCMPEETPDPAYPRQRVRVLVVSGKGQ